MKIAILIGVTNYDNLNKLVACKVDIDLMEKILRSSGEYSDIRSLSEQCSSELVKEKISKFVSEYHDKEIDEVFFYFTGHGDFYDNQFYYLLSDFNKQKRKQTSLENSEVDNWLRSLNPKLSIKFVDACHSGIEYIKDNENSINEYVKKSESGFQKCYFMFSSLSTQSLYQDENISFFTKSFLCSLRNKKENQRVRYKDIIDYISDDFFKRGKYNQTPTFVVQGTYTETFCSITPGMLDILSSLCESKDSKTEEEKDKLLPNNAMTLEEIIKSDAAKYLSAEEANKVLASIKEKSQQFSYSSDICSIFDIKYTFSSHDEYQRLPKEPVIGSWLEKKGNYYFATPAKEEESYEDEVPDYFSPVFSISNRKYRTVTRYRTVIVGFRDTANLSYNLLSINAEPKYPNVVPLNCTIVILVSKNSISFFYFYAQYKEKNWTDREIATDIKWQICENEFKDQEKIISVVNDIQEKFSTFIMNILTQKFEHLKLEKQ